MIPRFVPLLSPHRRVATAIVLVALSHGTFSQAHGGGAQSASGKAAYGTVSELPPGPLKRGLLDAQQQLRTLEQPEGLIDRPVQASLLATERSRGAKAAGDVLHGGMLDKLAAQWGEVAAAIVGAIDVERKAEAVAARVKALTTKVERAQSLLIEQQARLGRLRAEVQDAEAQARSREHAAAAEEDARLKKASAKRDRRRGGSDGGAKGGGR